MWTDISQFDIPEHLKTTAYGPDHARRFTEIGEVCVVNSMFGRAKVRVIHPQHKRSLVWPLAVLAATGVAIAVWLEQDTPKPPEPMRIIVRSVASEGDAQMSPQTLQAVPAMVNKAAPPAAPAKTQTPPGTQAKAAMVEKPVIAQPDLPPKSGPAATVPAAKPSMPVKPPAIIQPVAQPDAAQAAAPAIKNNKPANKPAVEPLSEENSSTMVPASNGTAPDQTGAQP
ncbi:MAG: hypothetical protein ACOY9D_08260 [Pseudomonadota bacterium]